MEVAKLLVELTPERKKKKKKGMIKSLFICCFLYWLRRPSFHAASKAKKPWDNYYLEGCFIAIALQNSFPATYAAGRIRDGHKD